MAGPFPDCLRSERVLIRRDQELVNARDEAGNATQQADAFEGVVTDVAGSWIYVQVADPSGAFRGIWVNTALQREIAIMG